jgi:xanthine dehydrogenase YagT iron-sulfur-binding subunit
MTAPNQTSGLAASAVPASEAASKTANAPVVERPLTQYRAQPLSLKVNGRDVGPLQVPAGLMMIDLLHEYLDLTGSRLGCGQGICHACVVILDKPDGTSEEVRTCITGANFFDGKSIRTVEGHAQRNEVRWWPCRRSSRSFSSTSVFSAATVRPALSMQRRC